MVGFRVWHKMLEQVRRNRIWRQNKNLLIWGQVENKEANTEYNLATKIYSVSNLLIKWEIGLLFSH